MQRHGFDVSVVRVVKGTYNPTNSSIINSEQIIPCRAMMFDLTLQSNGDIHVTTPSSKWVINSF